MIFLTDKSGKLLTKDRKLIKAPEACERYIGLSVFPKLFTTEGMYEDTTTMWAGPIDGMYYLTTCAYVLSYNSIGCTLKVFTILAEHGKANNNPREYSIEHEGEAIKLITVTIKKMRYSVAIPVQRCIRKSSENADKDIVFGVAALSPDGKELKRLAKVIRCICPPESNQADT